MSIFVEQIELSNPDFFARAYADITREKPSFFTDLCKNEAWRLFS